MTVTHRDMKVVGIVLIALGILAYIIQTFGLLWLYCVFHGCEDNFWSALWHCIIRDI